MTIAVPYSWLKQISKEHLQKDDAPKFGHSPQFPWDEMALTLRKSLKDETFKIEPQTFERFDAGHLFEGLGINPKILSIDLSPLGGNLWFAIAESELQRLISILLAKTEDASAIIIDSEHQKGVVTFLAYEVFNNFRQLDFGKGFTPHLLEDISTPEQSCYGQTFVFSFGNYSAFTARIIFSEDFRHSWKERYAERTVSAPISANFAEKLSVILHAEAGRTEITTRDWEMVSPGDFLLLSQCTVDPSKDKGRVMLTFQGRPMYRARLKDGSLKILEFPLYHEVEATMAEKTHEPDENEEFEGYDLDYDDDIEHGHEHSEHGSEEHHIEDDVSHASLEEGNEAHGGFDGGFDELEGDHELAKESFFEESHAEGHSEEAHTEASVSEPPKEQEPLTVDSLPLTIVIEVGRIQISVRKLLEMQIGDLLELDLDPDSGVDLVVNGVVVGKGELLKIGETLGVRLLDKA